MSKHFEHQIDRLKAMILHAGSLVELAVDDAIRAVETQNADLARKVIDNDDTIDRMEIEIMEECLHTLALYQPVASDLRFIAAVLTINKDLERVGDLAVNLAEQAIFFCSEGGWGDPLTFRLCEESERVRSILRGALQALVQGDAALASAIRQADDEVDEIHRRVYAQVEAAIAKNPEETRPLIHVVSISRQLERIADHAVSIAEDVYYMVRGESLKHSDQESRISQR